MKRILGETSTDNDADILQCLMAASRRVDGPYGANRFFYSSEATLYFGVQDRWEYEVIIPDALAVSAVTEDIDGDGTFSRTWTEGTHFSLSPDGGFPKMGIAALPWGDYAFSSKGKRDIKVVGTWGYGDGVDGDPWKSSSTTGTVADSTGATLTISVSGGLVAGQTIKIGTEQIFVESVSGTSATVRRAVNGTTGAAHTAAAISTALYPEDVIRTAQWLAGEAWKHSKFAGLKSHRIGDFSEAFEATPTVQIQNMLGRVRKVVMP